jgi:hypothetical protein
MIKSKSAAKVLNGSILNRKTGGNLAVKSRNECLFFLAVNPASRAWIFFTTKTVALEMTVSQSGGTAQVFAG